MKNQINRGAFLKTIGFAMAGGIIAAGCNKDDDDDEYNNGLKFGQVEFKATPGNDDVISFMAATKKITIDWGDGTVDEYMPNGIEKIFFHEYLSQNLQTVSIVTESMTYFSCSHNIGLNFRCVFRELRFGKCTELKRIICSAHELTVLDIKNVVISLETLLCWDNQLTTLDVSGASKLTDLECHKNRLSKLDLNGCTNLWTLVCSYNQLTELNLNNCTVLRNVGCFGNQLTQLNLSGCTELLIVSCSKNQLSTSVLNAIFKNLPDRTQSDYIGKLAFSENPGEDSCDRSIYESKNWMYDTNLQ